MTTQEFIAEGYCVVLVTAPSPSEAEQWAKILVLEKLAACVTLLPVQSIYIWQGELCQESEQQMLIKTTQGRFAALADRLRSLHSYEVPEIIALPILAGLPAYLQWLSRQTD